MRCCSPDRTPFRQRRRGPGFSSATARSTRRSARSSPPVKKKPRRPPRARRSIFSAFFARSAVSSDRLVRREADEILLARRCGDAAFRLERHGHGDGARQIERRVEACGHPAVRVDREHAGADWRGLRRQHPELIGAPGRRSRQIRRREDEAARAAPEGARGRAGRHGLTGEVDAREIGRRQHGHLRLRLECDAPRFRHLTFARLGAPRRFAKLRFEPGDACAKSRRVTPEHDGKRDRRRRREPAGLPRRAFRDGRHESRPDMRRRFLIGGDQVRQPGGDGRKTAHFRSANGALRQVRLEREAFRWREGSQRVGRRLVS